MSNKNILKKIASVFFVAVVVACSLTAQKKYNIVKKDKIEKAKIEDASNLDPKENKKQSQSSEQLEQTDQKVEIEKLNVLDFDVRFGKVVKIQDNIAFVQISSKLLERSSVPIFFACDIRMRPVARLETMNVGYRDCFLFKILEGTPQQHDTVVARYYKTIDVVKSDENKENQKSENK